MTCQLPSGPSPGGAGAQSQGKNRPAADSFPVSEASDTLPLPLPALPLASAIPTVLRGRNPQGARVAALALGVAAALIAAEGLCRQRLGWPSYQEGQVFDRELGFRMIPGRVLQAGDDRGPFEDRTGELGFRSQPLPREPATAPVPGRVLVLGDSFVRAWDIRDGERFPEVAAAHSGTPLDLHFLCCDDWGTAQELLALRHYGPHLRPERIVLALYPENDLINNFRPFAGHNRSSAGDALRPYLEPTGRGGERLTYLQPLRSALRRHSALWAQLEWRAIVAGGVPLLPAPEPPERGLLPHSHQLFAPGHDSAQWDAAFAQTEFLLERVADEAAALGAELCVVVLPSIWQVQHCAIAEEQQRAFVLGEQSAAAAERDFEAPERRLAEFFRRRGLVALLPLEALRRAASATPQGIFLRDGHLDATGHRVVGEELAPWFAGRTLPTPTEPTSRGPVDLLPRGARAVAELDFTADCPSAFLLRGENFRRPEGWLGAPERLWAAGRDEVRVLLRVGPDPLWIEGVAGSVDSSGSRQGFPCRLDLLIDELPLASVTLEGPGRFARSVEHPFAALFDRGRSDAWPYLPVTLRGAGSDFPHLGLARLGFRPAPAGH
jgi:hypothetical protein